MANGNNIYEFFEPNRLQFCNGDESLEMEFFADGTLRVWTRDKNNCVSASTTLTKEEMLHIANRLSMWAGGVTQQITGD